MIYILLRRISLAILIITLFTIIFFGIVRLGQSFTQRSPQQPTNSASQDTFIDPNNPTATYNGQRLEVTYSNFPSLVPTRRSLLQWNLSTNTTSLTHASLLLYLLENNLPLSATVHLALYRLPDNWNETTVTANSAPLTGSLLETVTVSAGFSGQVRFAAAAVAAYLESERTGDGTASFLLQLDSGSGSLGFGGQLLFEDREGSANGVNGDEPAIETPATPTSTTTPTGTNTATATPLPVTTATATATPTVTLTATPFTTATRTPTATPTLPVTLTPTPNKTITTPIALTTPTATTSTLTQTPTATATKAISQTSEIFLPVVTR